MKRIYLMFLLLFPALVFSGTKENNKMKGNKKEESTIVLDTGMTTTLSAWLAYAGVRALWKDEEFQKKYPGEKYHLTFEEELQARQMLALIWGKTKKENSDHYLDDLLSVSVAGFMREYVWSYFHQPYWEKPYNLKMDKFEEWRIVNLSHHQTETRSRVR